MSSILSKFGKVLIVFGFIFSLSIVLFLFLRELVVYIYDEILLFKDDPQDYIFSNYFQLSIVMIILGILFFVFSVFIRFLLGTGRKILIESDCESLDENTKRRAVVVIPAYNEEGSIEVVIKDVRKYVDNIVVVNDGSTDRTENIARKEGVVVVSHRMRIGLGKTFRDGVTKAIELGAEIIVNIDADGQYEAADIPRLVSPIASGDYDLVMGSRFAGSIELMPKMKRFGNKLFTRVLISITGVGITDGQTGFRAFSKELAETIKIRGGYTYTQEMIIEAVVHKFRIAEIPINFRKREHGESKLMEGPFHFAGLAGSLLLRVLRDHYSMKLFGLIGILFSLSGILVFENAVFDWLNDGNIDMNIFIIALLLISNGIAFIFFALLTDMHRK